MTAIYNVKLELLRSGPSHNQLLSPLTPYIALCGAGSPVTLNLPFEHQQLLNRLARLRYDISGQKIPTQQRESEVRDIGEILGHVLGGVPTLISELAQAGCGGGLIHLRLSVSALELGMVPFEFAIGADGFSASGSPLFIQSQAPITITREVRRGQKLDVSWNRKPRILFAFACPGGLPAVPAQGHLDALRRAIAPLMKWQSDPNLQAEKMKSRLTILPNASLKSIGEACNHKEYTHVHILAHGCKRQHAGSEQYGIALCSENGIDMDIVDGDQLAIALTDNDATGGIRHRPTFVSLATCDSGSTNTIIAPGGNIAQQLHAGGIPWIIASQFPLWMSSSIIATDVLYNGILQGDDPRWVLYNLRQRLFSLNNQTHDWASIVAYAAIPDNFEQQIRAFRDKQRQKKLEVMFGIADQYLKEKSNPKLPEIYSNLPCLYKAIRLEYENWLKEFDSQISSDQEKANVYMLCGGAEKRIAQLLTVKSQDNKNIESTSVSSDSNQAQKKAHKFYKKSMELDPSNHWVISQYLLMCVVLDIKNQKPPPSPFGELWTTAQQIAKIYEKNERDEKSLQALLTLAELDILKTVLNQTNNVQKENGNTPETEEINKLCERLINTVDTNSSIIKLVQSQFYLYSKIFCHNETWRQLADNAYQKLQALDGD